MTMPREPTHLEPGIETIETEVCVVGGGVAGLCAALAASRLGARTVLVQDRAVLGGNASSEIRMWICGAHGRDYKEAGILEELQLANLHRNPDLNYSIWDTVLYGAARMQQRLDLRLCSSVCAVEMAAADRIGAVRAWHLTRQCWLHIRARQFIDCSGDSILRLSGAPMRWGREAGAEFGESAGLAVADRQTMGNSILIQLRESDPAQHRAFQPPEWAKSFPAMHHRLKDMKPTGHNFWWLELGGEQDTIADADVIRDELLATAYGAWAFIKNHPDGRGRGWELEWIGALPGKRENLRYEGDHLLRQQDIEAGGRFPDVIAYGGWTMDDHPPAAFHHPGAPTVHHPAPSPYGIPYRCLYSRRIANLFCAGRNISATHLALSSTRVMGTTAMLGQAAGTAAALAVRHGCDPRMVGQGHLAELQQRLLDEDQWLPGLRRPIHVLTKSAVLTASRGDPEPLRDGIDRRLGEDWHAWEGQAGDWVELRWLSPQRLDHLRLVGDSELHRHKRQPCSWRREGWQAELPASLPQTLRIEAEVDGGWRTVAELHDNRRRLIRIGFPPVLATAVRVVLGAGRGEGPQRFFALDAGNLDLRQPEPCPWPDPVWTGRGRA